jgi:hypothetical protein
MSLVVLCTPSNNIVLKKRMCDNRVVEETVQAGDNGEFCVRWTWV